MGFGVFFDDGTTGCFVHGSCSLQRWAQPAAGAEVSRSPALCCPRAAGVAVQTGNSCLSLSCTNVACFERPYLTDTSFCLSRWASHQWNGPLRPVCCLQAVCLASPPTQRRRRVPGTPGLPVSQQWHRAMGAWSFQPLPYRHRCAAEDVGMGGGHRLIGAP